MSLVTSNLNVAKGLYVSVTPSMHDRKNLSSVLGFIAKHTRYAVDTDYLHTTVIYSTTPIKKIKDAEKTVKTLIRSKSTLYRAKTTQFTYWRGHNNQLVLVLELDSDALAYLHYQLKNMGFETTFPDYKAHITLADDIKDLSESQLKDLVQELNTKVLPHLTHLILYKPLLENAD